MIESLSLSRESFEFEENNAHVEDSLCLAWSVHDIRFIAKENNAYNEDGIWLFRFSHEVCSEL